MLLGLVALLCPGCVTYYTWDYALSPFGHSACEVLALEEGKQGQPMARAVYTCGREETVPVRNHDLPVIGPLELPLPLEAEAVRRLVREGGIPRSRAALFDPKDPSLLGWVCAIGVDGRIHEGSPISSGEHYRWRFTNRWVRELGDHTTNTPIIVLASFLTPLTLSLDAATFIFQLPYWVSDDEDDQGDLTSQ